MSIDTQTQQNAELRAPAYKNSRAIQWIKHPEPPARSLSVAFRNLFRKNGIAREKLPQSVDYDFI